MKPNIFYCILFYWVGCIVFVFVVQCVFMWMGKRSSKYTLKDIAMLLFVSPIIIPTTVVVYPVYLIDKYFFEEKRQERQERADREQLRLKRAAKCREYGIPEDTPYLSFEYIHGAGTIYCKDCGHQEKVIGFVHGAYSCKIGRQCPHCHTFVAEYNESKHYHTIGLFNNDFLCPKCGEVIHRREDSWDKGKDSPLFCPKCHGYRLSYHMEYIT